MAYLRRQGWLAWLVIGLLAGLVIGGFWPDTPLHAVTTDRLESFAIATGFVDDGVEAIYFLDFLTGTLRGAVLSSQTRDFQARYERNIHADVAEVIQFQNANLQVTNAQRTKAGMPALPQVQPPQNPRYLIATGLADIRRGAMTRMRPGQAVIYVAEINTGIVLAYAVPWDQSAHAANQPSGGELILWAGEQFTTAIVRPE